MSMNSSTGFKKRPLLRPPSGMLSNARQYLKVVDISQSDTIIASNIRTEVAVIQEQINVLDKDKRIRTGQSSLQKSHVVNLKKWLRQVQIVSEKEDDLNKILKQMGVDNYEAGFHKLWKIMSNLDLIASKMTELQIVQFLKYDEMFQSLAEDSTNGQRILQAISKGGFAVSNFFLSQIALEREISLFEVVSELKRSGLNSSQAINSSRGFPTKTKDDTSELIQQLRTQNRKLTELLESIEKQQSKKPEPKRQQKVQQRSGSAKDIFAQLQGKYKYQISELNGKIGKLNQEQSQNRTAMSQMEMKLRVTEEELKSKEFVGKKPAAGTYQEALFEQMDKMKKGFEKKIQKILEESATKERDLRKKQYEYKAENQKIKWQKGLLLKKFEALSA